MKISYISDLHLDFHIPFTTNQQKWEKRTKDYIVNLIESTDTQDRDVLCLGGDYSHFNTQSIWAFEAFSQYYNQILIVTGNHDVYLISKNQADKYKNHSRNRIVELDKLILSNPMLDNVTHLKDSLIFTYKNIKFGGDTMWYPLHTHQQKTFFYDNSNDSRLILGMNIELEHMFSMTNYNTMINKGIDVMLTHVPIIPISSHQLYGNDSCYHTPVDELPKYIIQGHSHEQKTYNKAGSLIYMNAIGYPRENLTPTIKSFTI